MALLEAKSAEAFELASENKRLRTLLSAKEQTGLNTIEAEVIAYDPSKWVRAIVINRAVMMAFKEKWLLLMAGGVVGQVMAVSPNTAKVLMITDHASGIDVVVQNATRSRGVVEGAGDGGACELRSISNRSKNFAKPSGGYCELQYVLKDDELKIGDRVVTSGLDGVYPKGILVGTISDMSTGSDDLFHKIEVKPVVDFSSLENVLVVVELPVEEVKPNEKK